MVDVKEAIKIAKQQAAEVLDRQPIQLEEIERDTYKRHDVWSVTLSFVKPNVESNPLLSIPGFSRSELEYKRFLIDVSTGELRAVKLREVEQ